MLSCLLDPHFPLTYLIRWSEFPLIMTGDFIAQDTVWDKHTWIFKMPATWVVEGVIVNFHSDLQRPFLKKKNQKNRIWMSPHWLWKKKFQHTKLSKETREWNLQCNYTCRKSSPKDSASLSVKNRSVSCNI